MPAHYRDNPSGGLRPYSLPFTLRGKSLLVERLDCPTTDWQWRDPGVSVTRAFLGECLVGGAFYSGWVPVKKQGTCLLKCDRGRNLAKEELYRWPPLLEHHQASQSKGFFLLFCSFDQSDFKAPSYAPRLGATFCGRPPQRGRPEGRPLFEQAITVYGAGLLSDWIQPEPTIEILSWPLPDDKFWRIKLGHDATMPLPPFWMTVFPTIRLP